MQRLVFIPFATFRGSAFRHLSPGFDARSGEGARRRGGRFTPPTSFATLYLALTIDTAGAELRRQGARNPVGLEGLVPREVYRYAVDLSNVVDLRDSGVLDRLGIEVAAVTGLSWAFTQELGAAAHRLGVQAILSPSATGVGDILAVFPDQLRGHDLDPRLQLVWETPDDVPRW